MLAWPSQRCTRLSGTPNRIAWIPKLCRKPFGVMCAPSREQDQRAYDVAPGKVVIEQECDQKPEQDDERHGEGRERERDPQCRPKLLRLKDLLVIREADEIEDARPLQAVFVQTDPRRIANGVPGKQNYNEQSRRVEQVRKVGTFVSDP